MTHTFQAALAAAGLPDVRFHDLRHTCGSLLAEMGVPVTVIRDVLRHTQISTTANYYIHTPAPLTRDALDRLDDFLTPNGGRD